MKRNRRIGLDNGFGDFLKIISKECKQTDDFTFHAKSKLFEKWKKDKTLENFISMRAR